MKRHSPTAPGPFVHVLSALFVLATTSASFAQIQSQDFVLRSRPGSHFELYFISLPDNPSFADRANSSLSNPCDLSASAPDGLINADDAICPMWGGGDPDGQVGTFKLARLDQDSCRWLERRITRVGPLVYAAGETFDIIPGIGYSVQVPYDSRVGETEHRFTLSGPCEPPFPGRELDRLCPGSNGNFALLHLPYDTRQETTTDVFCSPDWPDFDADSVPDDCSDGIWDGHSLFSLQRYGIDLIGGRWGFQAAAIGSFFGPIIFPAPPFALERGESLLLTMERTALPRPQESFPDGMTCP